MREARTVVLTGAAGGIGAALAERFLKNGDKVIAIDRRREALHQLVATTPGLLHIVGDVSNEDDCQAFLALTKSHSDSVEILINCAGFFPITPLEEMTNQDWREIIDSNLTGPFMMVRTMLPLMKARGWGRIINFSSASIWEGIEGQTPYVAAKAGVVGFSRSLAVELGKYGITVNAITPGLTLTEPVLRQMPRELIEEQPALRAIKRDQHPSDLVGPVFFLASPDSDFVTAQILNVDGGKDKH